MSNKLNNLSYRPTYYPKSGWFISNSKLVKYTRPRACTIVQYVFSNIIFCDYKMLANGITIIAFVLGLRGITGIPVYRGI